MAIQRDKVIASAEKLVAKGKIDAAIREYERLLDDNANDVNTLNRVGDLWVRINRNDEAVKVFSRIADHYSRDGFFLKAIAIYKKINKLDPSKLDVYAKLADLYAKQGLAMEAKSQYQVLADYFLKHGDPGNALVTYRKIAELDPNSINVHVKLADLYSQNNQTAEALKEYDRVGRMLLKRGMLDEAVQVFRKALKIDASNVDLTESLITALVDAKDYANATQILETALESNHDNPRLIALLGRTLVSRGDLPAARETLERGLGTNPDHSGIRDILADVYLRQGATDQALEIMEPVVDAAADRADRSAVDLLNRIIRVDPTHAPTLEKLVSVYQRLREETNILSSLNSLAEAHIARGNHAAAASVLQDLVRKEPENAQHREKLAFVRQKLGGAVGEPVAPAAAPTAPSPPQPSDTGSFGEVSEFDFDLDEGLGFDLDLSVPEPLRFGGAPSPEEPEAIELDSPAEEVDFITEHLTEAEVFAKYGLSDKAAEHLRTVIDRYPNHAPAYHKLLFVYLDDGNREMVEQTTQQYISVLHAAGDAAAIDEVQAELLSRGYSATGAATEAPAAGIIVPAPEEEMSISFGDEVAAGEVEFDLDALPLDADVPISAASVEPLPEETLPIQEEELHPFDVELGTGDASEAVPYAPAVEELGEIDFYIEQELFEEAQQRLDQLVFRFPADPEVQQRRAALASARAAQSAAFPQSAAVSAAPTPATISAADIESELLSAIPDDDDGIELLMQPRTGAASAPTPAAEEGLFADEDDFFDLAAELEEELQEEEEPVSLSEEEQSLEEIFREFKKGVEQQLDSEDYDTHYNLGIAYKEMGLIDEAIGEFQLASKDPKRAIECCSMLGLCFLEKGMPQLAIKWYQKGLESPEITDEEHLGLLYDLGSAYLEVGDTTQAHKALVEVYGINNSYRDVVSRIKQLEDVKP